VPPGLGKPLPVENKTFIPPRSSALSRENRGNQNFYSLPLPKSEAGHPPIFRGTLPEKVPPRPLSKLQFKGKSPISAPKTKKNVLPENQTWGKKKSERTGKKSRGQTGKSPSWPPTVPDFSPDAPRSPPPVWGCPPQSFLFPPTPAKTAMRVPHLPRAHKPSGALAHPRGDCPKAPVPPTIVGPCLIPISRLTRNFFFFALTYSADLTPFFFSFTGPKLSHNSSQRKKTCPAPLNWSPPPPPNVMPLRPHWFFFPTLHIKTFQPCPRETSPHVPEETGAATKSIRSFEIPMPAVPPPKKFSLTRPPGSFFFFPHKVFGLIKTTQNSPILPPGQFPAPTSPIN